MPKRVTCTVKVVRDGVISKLSLPNSTPDPNAVGFSTVLSTPQFVSELGHVSQTCVTSTNLSADATSNTNVIGNRRLSFLPHKVPEKTPNMIPKEPESVAEAQDPLSTPQNDLNVQDQVLPPSQENSFPCEICGLRFERLSAFRKHRMKHEHSDKPHRCDQCEESFNHPVNLRIHRTIHTGQLYCPECKKIFPRLASIKAHVRLHEVEENLQCRECGDELPTQLLFDRHKEIYRYRRAVQNQESFSCSQCGKVFDYLVDLKKHRESDTCIRKPGYAQNLEATPCPLVPRNCDFVLERSVQGRQKFGMATRPFISSLRHRTNIRKIDRTGFRHKCPDCGKLFRSSFQLTRHLRIHTGERPFECETCGKTFNQKNALQSHMTNHSGERPHQCDFCPSTFSQKGNLRMHISRVHVRALDPNEPVYECKMCSCTFTKAHSLQAHVVRRHPDGIHPNVPLMKEIEQQYKHSKSKGENGSLQENGEKGSTDAGRQLQAENATNAEEPQTAPKEVLPVDLVQLALVNCGLAYTIGYVVVPVVSKRTPEDARKKQDEKFQSTTGPDNEVIVVSSTDPSTTEVVLSSDSANCDIKHRAVWCPCPYCWKEFKKKPDYVKHVRLHTHLQPFACNLCFRSFSLKRTLAFHLRNHRRKFSCSVCNKLLETSSGLFVHLMLRNSVELTSISCTECGTRFNTARKLRDHKELVHHRWKSGLVRNQFCKQSDTYFSFTQPIVVKRNCSFRDAKVAKKSYRCKHCTRVFKNLCHLKLHYRIHSREKPFVCDSCDYSSVNRNSVRNHMNSHRQLNIKSRSCSLPVGSEHGSQRLYMCPYCMKTFKMCISCKMHMKAHHQNRKTAAIENCVISEHSYTTL